jgi:hypothetical protein
MLSSQGTPHSQEDLISMSSIPSADPPRRPGRHSRLRTALAVAAAISLGASWLAACSDSSGPGFCSASAGFQTAVGTDVVFRWSSCALGSLSVIDPATGRVMWAISGRFESPVVYGTVPAGATEVQLLRNLQVGSTYLAFASVGNVSVGTSEFTR